MKKLPATINNHKTVNNLSFAKELDSKDMMDWLRVGLEDELYV